ncbi:nuclear transport factor 2 family protein [Thermodesulfobacteriota bacterium]
MELEELEKNVKTLEDINEIENMHREFIFWLNNKQWDEMSDCFAEKAVTEMDIQGGLNGEEKNAKIFIEDFARDDRSNIRQLVTQPVINVEGDRAKGYWILYSFFLIPTPPQEAQAHEIVKWVQGRYDCEYVREDGNWKFSYLKCTSPWPKSEWPDNVPEPNFWI